MSINFKSNEMKKYVSKQLNKNIDEIITEDLEQIKEIKLSHINIMGGETDCTLEDIDNLKNLQSCTLFKFNINDKDIEHLKSLSNLKYIHFDFCEFNLKEIELSETIETICFTMCKNLNINKMKSINIKLLKIIGNRNNKCEFDINDLDFINNLEELHIHNYDVKNVNEIMNKAPSIKKINLDGSIAESELLKILSDKIDISNSEIFINANA